MLRHRFRRLRPLDPICRTRSAAELADQVAEDDRAVAGHLRANLSTQLVVFLLEMLVERRQILLCMANSWRHVSG